jgi:hypothetical protein
MNGATEPRFALPSGEAVLPFLPEERADLLALDADIGVTTESAV